MTINIFSLKKEKRKKLRLTSKQYLPLVVATDSESSEIGSKQATAITLF
jgi:hypothetical protein